MGLKKKKKKKDIEGCNTRKRSKTIARRQLREFVSPVPQQLSNCELPGDLNEYIPSAPCCVILVVYCP